MNSYDLFMMKRLPMLILLFALASSATAELPIIADDFPRARAEATKRKVPLFIEVWAPW